MKNPILALSASLVLVFIAGCGPSKEDKALKVERVELLEMQHQALSDGPKNCTAAQKRLDAFGAKNKDRLDAFNAKWEALEEDRRKKLLSVEPYSSKEVNDDLIALIVSCPGIKRPVSSK